MIKNDIVETVVDMIKEHPESVDVNKRAVAYVADYYPIGKIVVEIHVNVSLLPFDSDVSYYNLLDSGAYSEEGEFVVDMPLQDCGRIISRIFPTDKVGQFTEEQKSDLHIMATMFHFYTGQYKIVSSLKRASMCHYMSGLYNPKGYIIKCMELSQRYNIRDYDSCYFNIKGFGLVNNIFGSHEGDVIIKRYAKDLQNFINEDENVGHLGGDNFVAFVRRTRMDEFLGYIFNYTGYGIRNGKKKEIKLSATIGISPLDRENVMPNDIISEASLALSYARQTKQDMVVLNDELKNKLYQRKQIEETFDKALENGEFVPFYQPKVDIRNGKLVGAEALSRWKRDGRLISPAEFIPVLEQNGSITELDFYIFEETCKNLAKWRDEGIKIVPVSINFSRKHLDDENLADRINQIIMRYDVDKEYIVAEITETADYDEKELMTRFLDKMQIYKIKTSIDDFGTGYSSLGILRDFDVNEIKIDRSFINRPEFLESDNVIVGSIVSMANRLHLDIITEGVENKNQVEFLKKLDCYYVQGFLFDKPLPQDEFEERLRIGGYDLNSKEL